jgi:hypothetical protein
MAIRRGESCLCVTHHEGFEVLARNASASCERSPSRLEGLGLADNSPFFGGQGRLMNEAVSRCEGESWEARMRLVSDQFIHSL